MTTKESIAETFIKLSHVKRIDKITVRDIVEDCGLTKTTFYNHFQDKYDLIVWIYAGPVKDIVNRLGMNYDLRTAIVDFLNYSVDKRQFIINAIKNTSGQNFFLNHVSRIHFTALRDFVKSKIGSSELPLRLEILLKLYAFGSVQLVCEWLISKMPIPIDKFAEYIEAGLPDELTPYLPKTIRVDCSVRSSIEIGGRNDTI